MNYSRRERSRSTRVAAAELSASRPHPRHIANGEEQQFRFSSQTVQHDGCGGQSGQPNYLASFTKGMRHCYATGLIQQPEDFQRFVKAVDTGDPRDFIDTPLGPDGFQLGQDNKGVWRSQKAKQIAENGANVRAWESQGAGSTFELEGPDAQSVTMPPAPKIGSFELSAEIGEVYAQALLRDVPFTQIVDGCQSYTLPCKKNVPVAKILRALSKLSWFDDNLGYKIRTSGQSTLLNDGERKRLRPPLQGQTFFRGITQGDDIGPYLSQFMLAGTSGLNGDGSNSEGLAPADGYIGYGALTVNQRVRFAKPCDDHMTSWDEWYDVQQGADLRGQEAYDQFEVSGVAQYRRFITTPRDLATYVHYDALYEAYLNACLILLETRTPFDPGIPFQYSDSADHQQGFAHFGGPHILSLVTEVATRALKAVRFQKFNVHRRMRPEVLAARLAKQASGDLFEPELQAMLKELQHLLPFVDARNGADANLSGGNFLLPMAFCEGSPMHPSYGAGHATVAGACITILKAFFDHYHPFTLAGDDQTAFVPTEDGASLVTIPVVGGRLTVEGELNKLASNISIGRNWAGVHYFSDYIESLRMGEQIAIGILEEQKLTYGESFSMTVPLFDGGAVRI